MTFSQACVQWIDNGGVLSARGFRGVSLRAGIKTEGDDLCLLWSESPATCAAVFTQNVVKAAPVWISAEHATNDITRAIVCNSGNANCCTGEQGRRDAIAMCQLASRVLDCQPREVLVCSTGIIGHPLPMPQIESALQNVDSSAQFSSEQMARAVMTTDLVPKFCAVQFEMDGQTVTIGGQAKGVGMIGPDMAALQPQGLHATMLAFLTTDARIEKPLLQRALEEVVARSFNSVTVDGDTSTNDSCILLANGASGVEISEIEYSIFVEALQNVCVELAKKIARDGEGATKLVQIDVWGAANESDAKTVAMTIATSPLVKTAIFGRDPNWGRIAAAAGRSGVAFNPAKMSISIGAVEVFRNGEPTEFDLNTAEEQMSHDDLTISIQLGVGSANWTAWTCDFSYEYVKINAEYHT
ncbi:MAG TPA: bifunctional glutamate N-acetyltransferase/amino-acid acetyltransferase ArgJ [Abditibacteriaceae bacterium]|nr:bifunctional glutamate N-acetyltransferase/amino-acid acetyltransferase ArgJ [Abditibacteriaceae bacterium]